VLVAMAKGDFAAAEEHFDDRLRAALPVASLQRRERRRSAGSEHVRICFTTTPMVTTAT